MRVIRDGEGHTQRVDAMAYRDVQRPVRDVTVRWLSMGDYDDCGRASYGLRVFTVGPGGEIPIHAHRYAQTVYVLSGAFECLAFDPETDGLVESCRVGPGEAVAVAPWEPHGMKNASDTEDGVFLCCIANLPESESERP